MAKKYKMISAERVVIVSLLVDISDVVLGVVLTVLSGSVVVLSQVLEGIADLLSSGLLVFGLHRSKRNADSTHPFGYGRELYFWTLIAALLMMTVTATLTTYLGWQRFTHPEPLRNTIVTNVVLLLTIFSNGYALSLSTRRLLQNRPVSKIWSVFYQSSLIETKTAFVLDLIGASASLVGFVALLLYELTGDGRFDGLGAITIGFVLALLAFMLLLAIKDFLIGKSVSMQTIQIIKKAVYRTQGINSIQDLKAAHMGPDTILINIEVNAQDDLTTNELETLIDNVKDEIRKDLPSAKQIQVELESIR